MILLYIDPGTGSMLFSLAIGIATAGVFAIRALVIKAKFIFSGGKSDKAEKERIPYVIYSDHKRYWNVFKPVCDEFERRGIDLVYLTQSEDDPVLSQKYNHIKAEFIGEGNKGFARLNFLNAGILLSTTPGLDVYQWKKSRSVKWYVHIPHSVDDVPATYRMFGTDYYDAFLTSGNHQEKVIRKLEQLRNLPPKEVVLTGSTYLDSMKAKKQMLPPLAQNENLVILLAPSWGKNGILSKFGSRFIDALIQTGYQIVIRPHPQSVTSEKEMLDNLKEKYPQIEWNFDNDNFNILNRADLLISDFSGVIYDFSLILNKPVIYADTDFDTLPYDADWLDEKIWSLRVLPKIGTKLEEKDFPDLKNVIENTLKSKKLEKGRKEVKEECWCFENDSAGKTVDYIIEKSKELTV